MSDKSWITQNGVHIFINDRLLIEHQDKLVGALKLKAPEIFIIASASSLLLFTDEMELVEKLDTLGLFGEDISKLGLTKNGTLAVESPSSYWLADEDIVNWSQSDKQETTWSISSNLPITLEQTLAKISTQNILSWETVLLDLHSGRILGDTGIWLFDLASIVIIILSFTGLWIWLRSKNLKKKS